MVRGKRVVLVIFSLACYFRPRTRDEMLSEIDEMPDDTVDENYDSLFFRYRRSWNVKVGHTQRTTCMVV